MYVIVEKLTEAAKEIEGVNLAVESVICNETPDDDGTAKCNALA